MLVLTPATKATVYALSHRAHQSPFTTPHIRRLFRRTQARADAWSFRTVTWSSSLSPTSVLAGFAGSSLSHGPDKWPTMADVEYLMAHVRLQNDSEHCLTWPDGSEQPRTVNVLEPLDGDWSPLRSS